MDNLTFAKSKMPILTPIMDVSLDDCYVGTIMKAVVNGWYIFFLDGLPHKTSKAYPSFESCMEALEKAKELDDVLLYTDCED